MIVVFLFDFFDKFLKNSCFTFLVDAGPAVFLIYFCPSGVPVSKSCRLAYLPNLLRYQWVAVCYDLYAINAPHLRQN